MSTGLGGAMRIRTRLFLGTAALVLALVALQFWLQLRQLRAVEGEIARVATSIGRGLLMTDVDITMSNAAEGDSSNGHAFSWVAVAGDEPDPERDASGAAEARKLRTVESELVVVDGQTGEVTERRVERRLVSVRGETPEIAGAEGGTTVDVVGPLDPGRVLDEYEGADGTALGPKIYHLRVVAEGASADRVLVIADDRGAVRQVPIPVKPTIDTFRANLTRGLAGSAALLAVGLLGAAVLAQRLGGPLQELSRRAERLGAGDLGVQGPETGAGEVGDLQRAFNAMSSRLAELEGERQRWHEREHLAQLGDLSRGLAHTMRNPLNTLGLAVEELAAQESADDGLVRTARSQIARIDRWLRSFLALGAASAVETECEDLADIVRGVVLESVQQGRAVELEIESEPLPVLAIGAAVRAAVANLVDNAAEVTGSGQVVEVAVRRAAEVAELVILDRGPGVPGEVRERLFAPHVTTKVGGSGMGLFLARQLIVGMHGGALEVADREGGGTAVTVRLPLVDRGDAAEVGDDA